MKRSIALWAWRSVKSNLRLRETRRPFDVKVARRCAIGLAKRSALRPMSEVWPRLFKAAFELRENGPSAFRKRLRSGADARRSETTGAKAADRPAKTSMHA